MVLHLLLLNLEAILHFVTLRVLLDVANFESVLHFAISHGAAGVSSIFCNCYNTIKKNYL